MLETNNLPAEEHRAILVIRTKKPLALRDAQLKAMQESLSQRFIDAEFEVLPAPSWFQGWSSVHLPSRLSEIYEKLLTADDWLKLDEYPQVRVWVHRLNHKLPDYLRVVNKRYHGYKLKDLRKENASR